MTLDQLLPQIIDSGMMGVVAVYVIRRLDTQAGRVEEAMQRVASALAVLLDRSAPPPGGGGQPALTIIDGGARTPRR